MKNLFAASFFILVSNLAFAQTEWAPQGAKWWYTYSEWLFGAQYVVEVSVIGDTIIQGKNCSILKNEPIGLNWNWGCNNPEWNVEYMYGEDSKVFFYNSFEGTFKLLYDFNSVVGEGWKVPLCDDNFTIDSLEIIVENIYFDTISSQPLKIIDVDESINGFPSIIYDGIGSARQMFFQEQNIVTAEQGITKLRCYESPATGTIKFIEQPCDFISPANEAIENQTFILSPNPTAASATLTYTLPPHKVVNSTSAEVLVLDSYGRTIQQHPLPLSSDSLILDDLLPGLYFIVLQSEGQVIKTEKLLRF